jgi:hypothetical protein
MLSPAIADSAYPFLFRVSRSLCFCFADAKIQKKTEKSEEISEKMGWEIKEKLLACISWRGACFLFC